MSQIDSLARWSPSFGRLRSNTLIAVFVFLIALVIAHFTLTAIAGNGSEIGAIKLTTLDNRISKVESSLPVLQSEQGKVTAQVRDFSKDIETNRNNITNVVDNLGRANTANDRQDNEIKDIRKNSNEIEALRTLVSELTNKHGRLVASLQNKNEEVRALRTQVATLHTDVNRVVDKTKFLSRKEDKYGSGIRIGTGDQKDGVIFIMNTGIHYSRGKEFHSFPK